MDDVATGVRVTFEVGTYSIITRNSSGMVREVEHNDGDTYVYETENGVLETGYVENGSRGTFGYDFDASDILPLEPWSRASGTQTTRDENANEIDRVGFSYHTLGEGSYRIGECTYAAIKVQTHYAFEDGATMIELTFLTELGIPLNTAYRADGMVNVHRALSITAE